MSIATKTGDEGETSLMYGRRVSKTDARVDAYGCVDELNASLGLARVTATNPFLTEQIFAVQKELVIVMGELATAPEDLERYVKDGYQLTSVTMTDRLTSAVDDLEKNKLGKFKGWAVPGKTMDSAALDLARTVCRRAERNVVRRVLSPRRRVRPPIAAAAARCIPWRFDAHSRRRRNRCSAC